MPILPSSSVPSPFKFVNGTPTGPLFNKGGEVFDVKAYGAVGDGTTDDTTAIRAAITAAANSGVVFFPPGIYITGKLTIDIGLWFVGSGYETTIIKLKNSTNDNVIESNNFSTLTGTDTSSTPYNFGIINMTIDGNKANQSSGNGIALYAYGHRLDNVRVRNCKGWGIWQEWGTSSSDPANGDSMEAFITNYKIHHCDTGGQYFKGPHDTQFHNGIVYKNGNNVSGAKNLYIVADQYGSGSVFSMIHLWGGTYDYAIYNNCTGITFADCQVEGAKVAEIYNAANSCNFENVKVFSLESNSVSNVVKGLVLANSATKIHGTLKMENIGGGVLDLTASAGVNNLNIFADYYTAGVTVPNPAIIGSIDSNSTINLHLYNGTTSKPYSVSYMPEIITNDITTFRPLTSNASAEVDIEASGSGNESNLRLIGHNSSNDGDYGLLSLRSENPDLIFSVYDNSAATYHQFFTYQYLLNRLGFLGNTLTTTFGSYNTPLNAVMMNLVNQDDSNNVTPSSVDLQLRFNSGAYTEASGKMAKISAIRANADFANTVDLAFFTSPTNSTTLERVRITNDGKVGVGTTGPTQLLSVSEKFQVNSSGTIPKYNNVATAGLGVPAIYGFGRSTAQTAAVASVATYTVGSSDGSFAISANVLVTASATHNFTVTCAYTDEGNTSRTLTLNLSQLAGTLVTAITNTTGIGPYGGVPVHIRAKASTSITIATTGTFTSVTYNVEGLITQKA